MKSLLKGQKLYALGFTILAMCFGGGAYAQTTAAAEPVKKSILSNPVFLALLSIIILLMIVIVIFAKVARGAVQMKVDELLKKNSNITPLLVTGMLLTSAISFAQGTAAPATSTAPEVAPAASGYFGMDTGLFVTLLTIILFELIAIRILYVVIMEQLGVPERKEEALITGKVARKKKTGPTVMDKFNGAVPIEKEHDIMLDHNYDGIHELDNNLPPWWKYGFYVSIVFAIVYLVHYHITKTGPLQDAEYKYQMYQAKLDIEAYKAKAANLVDETNAELLTDPSALASGGATFKNNCAACHGAAGEGGVGPNLTDDYWLHGGGIKDVFKTIKYGYPEKGMKAWEQDLGAKQIHEVASYVKSLHGTKPANGKEPQGELYVENEKK